MTSTRDIKKLGQVYLRDQGFYSGEIDGVWGALSRQAFDRHHACLERRGLVLGQEKALVEDAASSPPGGTINGVVVIDPGHGGRRKVGGSSANNATSASGVPEKAMTLDLAKRIRRELGRLAAKVPGSDLSVHLTRAGDRNLGLSARARCAETHAADIFVSLHFNGFNGAARGTETWILSAGNGNLNEADDRALAERVQQAMCSSLQGFDDRARDRGIKDGQRLGVLSDISLGNARGDCRTRACLVEVEFIDHPDVDRLLNTGPEARRVKDALAASMAAAIVDDLRSHARPAGRNRAKDDA
jgi:N-acetylmuramoyl-L-alanine amidase